MNTRWSKCVLGGVALSVLVACGNVAPSEGADASGGTDASADATAPPDAMLSWSRFERVDVDFTESIMTPLVGPEGQTLYFTTLVNNPNGDNFDVYFASGDADTATFGAAAPLPGVNVTGTQQRYIDVSSDGLELYYSEGDVGPIMVSTRARITDAFGAPTPVGVSGNFPTISGDKLSLYFIAQVQGVTGAVQRITRAAPGQPWSIPSDVPLPGVIEIYSSIDISRDELSILRAPPLTGGPQGDILIGRRQRKTDAFESFEVVATVDGFATAFASARWNADETEIWINQSADNIERPFVSRLR